MVVHQLDQDEVDRVFAALADPTRRDIVARVLIREASVSALAERYAMSFAAVQKHVAVLERAGLVSKQPHGRERLVRGDVDTIRVRRGCSTSTRRSGAVASAGSRTSSPHP